MLIEIAFSLFCFYCLEFYLQACFHQQVLAGKIMISHLKKTLKKIPGFKLVIKLASRLRAKKRRVIHSEEGKVFYDSVKLKNAGYQKYFIENKDDIYSGKVPERYRIIASVTPGRKVLELGSADGTQALVLATEKEAVCGVELMEMQYRTALGLKEKWIENGAQLDNLRFVHGGIKEFEGLLDEYDTVVMSRVLYHLRSDVENIMSAIAQSKISNVLLVGCPERARRFKAGGSHGDAMGAYAKLATQHGMEEVLEMSGFSIAISTPDNTSMDPIVVGVRHVVH